MTHSICTLLSCTLLAPFVCDYPHALAHAHTHPSKQIPSKLILFIEWIIPLNDIYTLTHARTMRIILHSIIELFIETKSILKSPRPSLIRADTEWIIWKWFSLYFIPSPVHMDFSVICYLFISSSLPLANGCLAWTNDIVICNTMRRNS